MRRGQSCAYLQPDYDRLEDAFYISRDPDTHEVSWPPTRMMDELRRFGLVDADCREDRMEAQGTPL
jgi:hypothetical protein